MSYPEPNAYEEDELYKFFDSVWFEIKYFLSHIWINISRFFKKIYKIIQYVPILYNDEDWAIDYAIELFCYKLRRLSNAFNKYGHIVGSKKIAKDILETEKLLIKSLNEDNYCKEDYKEHEKRWGKLKSNGEGWTEEDDKKWCLLTGHTQKDIDEDKACTCGKLWKAYYTKAKNIKDEKQASKELMAIFTKQGKLMGLDMSKAFKIIVENRGNWVD